MSSSSSSSSSSWEWDGRVVAATVAAAGVLAGTAYWLWGRFGVDPHVSGQRVLEANAPALLRVWRYHQWFGQCDKRAFRKVLQETLQSFFARQAVELVQKAARRVSGQGDGLTRSQIVQDHPWIEDFIAHLDEELSDGISITLPDHFVDQVFRLFDANADGSVTKQEWVSKCNILTTEGTDQRIAALFTLIDEDGDGLLSEGEVFRVISDSAQLANESVPSILNQLAETLTDRLLRRFYSELQIPFGRVIPQERVESFLIGLRKSLPHDWVSRSLDGLIKKSELDVDDLFRRYAIHHKNPKKNGEDELGVTEVMFAKLLEDVIDLDALFLRFDSILSPSLSADRQIQSALESLRQQLRDRFAGESFSISSLVFRMLDLDDSGCISKIELQGFVDLLNHSAQQINLTKSYGPTEAGLAAFNSTFETEVSYVMHVLSKNRRVSFERLKGLIASFLGFIKTLIGEYVEVHTSSSARDTELKQIVHAWYKSLTNGKQNVPIKSVSSVLGSIVNHLD